MKSSKNENTFRSGVFKWAFRLKRTMEAAAVPANVISIAILAGSYIDTDNVPYLAIVSLLYPLAFLMLSISLIFRLFGGKMRSGSSWIALALWFMMFGRAFTISFPEDHDSGSESLKLLTYNVNNFNRESGTFGTDIDIAAWVNYVNPDVICLQEYLHYFTKNNVIENLYSYKTESYVAKSNYGHQGSIILSKYPIIESFNKNFDDGSGSISWADIVLPHDTVRLFNISMTKFGIIDATLPDSTLRLSHRFDHIFRNNMRHFKDIMTTRANQADSLALYINDSPFTTVVCGNLQDTPFSYTYNVTKGDMEDAFRECGKGFGFTLKSFFYPLRSDYVLYSRKLKAYSYESPSEKWSSYNPVIVSFRKNPGNPFLTAFPYLNEKTWLHIIFWSCLFVLFYTYIGYGLLIFLLGKIKEQIFHSYVPALPDELPRVSIIIPAFNEEEHIRKKIENLRQLDYPEEKIQIICVTDGSTDNTNSILEEFDNVITVFSPEKNGITSAYNNGIKYVTSPITIFTDVRSEINKEAVKEIVMMLSKDDIGCVACEKRAAVNGNSSILFNEGFYWKYESWLKMLEWRLNSAIGASGELFGLKTDLFELMADNIISDDIALSMKIAKKGYKVAYTRKAYAIKEASADMSYARQRKEKIAAGNIQLIWKLARLLNILEYKTLSFQYISHRVLRWAISPILVFVMLPLNIVMVAVTPVAVYIILLIIQLSVYVMVMISLHKQKKGKKIPALFVPCYFIFSNLNMLRGYAYLINPGKGMPEEVEYDETETEPVVDGI